ncbi:hypothetical protein B0I35DRAFT_428913 [Stachybotrys elegans]|uniref:Uncharacterized protein n=1 Tax=Stachybotrys elegans TaxID=80388 RepID=A0A8K0WSW7_9HYPO|nr:hypothetical protein B0I35DRAFT_428913 [Stachybotrys elegans]
MTELMGCLVVWDALDADLPGAPLSGTASFLQGQPLRRLWMLQRAVQFAKLLPPLASRTASVDHSRGKGEKGFVVRPEMAQEREPRGRIRGRGSVICQWHPCAALHDLRDACACGTKLARLDSLFPRGVLGETLIIEARL